MFLFLGGTCDVLSGLDDDFSISVPLRGLRGAKRSIPTNRLGAVDKELASGGGVVLTNQVEEVLWVGLPQWLIKHPEVG